MVSSLVTQKLRESQPYLESLSSTETSLSFQLKATSAIGVARAYTSVAEVMKELFKLENPPVFVYSQANRERNGNEFTMLFKVSWKFNQAKCQELKSQKVRRL